MKYYTIPPSVALSEFVRFFWILESNEPGYIHRSMPDVCPEMVFHYQGQFNEMLGETLEPASFSVVQGPLTSIRRFQINKAFGNIWRIPLSVLYPNLIWYPGKGNT
jgi:hypothetical protein